MEPEDLSRRSLLHAIVATLGAAALPLSWEEIAQAAHQAHAATPPSGKARLSFLSAVEAAHRTLRDRGQPDTPGAREAGAVYFIDRALATFLSRLAIDYRTQLTEFQAAFHGSHPGAASFSALPSAEQVDYLKTVDRTPFFETTRLLTLLGMFSNPAYGGNRNGAGWKLIGFEDRHAFQPPFGYYDRDYAGFVDDPVKRP